MAANKRTFKFRSITYPNNECSGQKKQRGRLQRMRSFDLTANELSLVTHTPKPSTTSRREVSAEGKIRSKQFKHPSRSSSPISAGLKLLRFSDECCYNPPGEQQQQQQQQHASGVNCLATPKPKPDSSIIRSGVGNNVERLMNWSRQSPEKHNARQDMNHHRCRSKERRVERESANERRGHCSGTSISLPPPARYNEENSTETLPGSTTEGRGRRSQFRRAFSLFSIACDKEVERERDKSPHQKILRPPTRHFYRRGVSGLPIECSPRYLGLAF